MPYVLPTSKIDPSLVGDSYHLALGLTSPGQASPDRIFGYLLAEGTKFQQKTDIKARDSLINYSSPHLIDRDLVTTPRVSDGDFSGGALQINFSDPSRYWDSDLEVRNPGYLTLAPAWARRTMVNPGINGPYQVVAYLNQVWLCGTSGTNIYRAYDGAVRNTGINVKRIETDGNQIFAADGVNTLRVSGPGDPTIWTDVSVAIGPIQQMWAANLGTGGRFMYYTTDGRTLKKVDLATNTIGIDVPLGGSQYLIVDVCPYLAGVAIVTIDPSFTGFDVWYHDGQNFQHIIRVNQYYAKGICQCLGQLFVTATSTGWCEGPVLMQVSAGSFQILLRLGIPTLGATFTTLSAPVSSGQYVAFGVTLPQINGISAAGYIGVYDVLGGTYSHLPNMDANDNPNVGMGIGTLLSKTLAFSGRAIAYGNTVGGATVVQYQMNSQSFNAGYYQSPGWLFSSRFDFNTPGIEKMFRRILVHHAPLRAGESIQVNAYVDKDPTTLTTGSPVNPALATVSNSVVSTTTTALILPQHTLGFSMVVGIKLIGGSDGGFGPTTSPTVYYFSVEAAVSWAWTFTLDCSSRRRMLNGQEDNQGLRSKDLIMLIQTAWENALPLTFYHPNGSIYTANIEEALLESENPLNRIDPEHSADLEGVWTLTLRDGLV